MMRDEWSPASPALLTVAEVALHLQLSERSVRRWIACGQLPAIHIGRAVRIRMADLARITADGLPSAAT